MKSTDKKTTAFSMDDFEKGLMLAGILLPRTVEELDEQMALQKYEKTLALEKKQEYFKRVVLAAEIANELHAEPTFGRVKFQKMMYLCERAAKMTLHERYLKQAAGPFDNKFMHTINTEFKRNNWFGVEKVTSGDITRTKYKPLSNVEKYKDYYSKYFRAEDKSIKHVINLFRTAKSDFTEIAATLIACHINLENRGQDFTVDELMSEFYSWSEAKGKFEESNVRFIWRWVVDNGLV